MNAKFAAECSEANVAKFKEWFAKRGGIAIWHSINLSNPGGSWTTPARDPEGNLTQKPNWQCENVPTIITDPAQVGVYAPVLYKEIPVKLKQSGTALVLTDASHAKVDRALRMCNEQHGNAFAERGGLEDPVMTVFYINDFIPLNEVRS